MESLPKHNKLCHGDYCPDNILVETDDAGKITAITAVDWVHATQGNASADVANTYLMLKLVDESFAEKYLVDFCKRPIPTAATSIHASNRSCRPITEYSYVRLSIDRCTATYV